MQVASNFVSLADFGLLEVAGFDAEQFLQGQLTIDVTKLSGGKLQLAGYCNLKGRLHSLFYIIRLDAELGPRFHLLLPAENLPHLMTTLKKYALFSKVIISDATMHWREQTLSLWPALADQIKLVSPVECRIQSIKSKTPWILKATEEKFLPHHVNLPALGGVDFTKGCYVGQEIVARMEYLGKNKKKLYIATAHTDEPILEGTALFPQGEVVLSAPLTSSTQILLIMLADESPNVQLRAFSNEGPELALQGS